MMDLIGVQCRKCTKHGWGAGTLFRELKSLLDVGLFHGHTVAFCDKVLLLSKLKVLSNLSNHKGYLDTSGAKLYQPMRQVRHLLLSMLYAN
jgi:hypothetical protein